MKNRILYFTVSLLGGLALTLTLIFLFQQIVPVQAAPGVLYVAPMGDCNGASPCYGNVQAALGVADNGDIVKVAAGTYVGVQNISSLNTDTFTATQMVAITKSVTIRGGYTTTNWESSNPITNSTTMDAQRQGRVFYITGDISPTIEGLRITGGNSAGLGGGDNSYEHTGGGIYVISATVFIKDNLVFSNTAYYAGGLYLSNSATTLMGNTISSNAAQMAAGLYLDEGDIILSGNNIISNTAAHIGGLYVNRSTATLVNNIIAANIAESGYGGGLLLGGGNITLDSNVIAANSAKKGGGLYIWDCEDPIFAPLLVNNVVADNHASENGNGLFVSGCSPRLIHNTISRNTGGDGSGIYVTWFYYARTYSNVVMTNTILVSHTVGISVTGGNTVTANSLLWHNTPITVSQASTATVAVQNQHTGDPAFTADGYHINSNSAAINIGEEAGLVMDMDGEARPFDNAPDIGADEWATTETIAEPSMASTITATVGGLTTTVEVPVGSVTESTTLRYTALAVVNYATPSNFTFAGHAFDLDAYRYGTVLLPNFAFNDTVTTTIHYADTDVAGLDESTLVLEYWNGVMDAWDDAACGPYDRHPDENWLTVPICHLSSFALFGEEYSIYLPIVLRNY